MVNSAVAREKVDLTNSQQRTSQQEQKSNLSLPLTEQESSHSNNERDERSVRSEPESSQSGIGLEQIIDSLTDSSRRAEELATILAENLRGPSIQAETAGRDQSDSNRETEKPGNSNTESNRAAAELAREWKKLEQRARSSNLKNRKTRKPLRTNLGRYPEQLVEKTQQFTRDITTDSEKSIGQQRKSKQQTGIRNDNQISRTTQENRDYSTDYQSGDWGTQPYKSPQQKDTSRNQGQSQQQRNPSQPNREEAVEAVQPAKSPSVPLSQPLSQDEVSQILLTALSALKRYGSEWDKKRTFNNDYYQIQKFSVFETYGYRSYLTIDAKDGRGRLLTMKGQNFHPANLKIQENHLTKQDGLTFEKIQSALDYLQQICQFKENAQTILLKYGERDPHQPFKSYGTLEGKKYQIVSDEQAFRVIAKDGRGEILNYPSDPYARNPEAKAQVNFNQEDMELFSTLAQQIEQERREAERNRQRELSQKRQQGRGLER